MTRTEELREACEEAGFTVRTYSPGDGVTRYRFFTLPQEHFTTGPCQCERQTYFGPANGDYTALGLREARAYAAGRGANPNGSMRHGYAGIPWVVGAR